MSQEPITLASYDPEWVDAYEKEEQQIRNAAGEHIEAIEHIGSTSIPGLAAKPIIDIMAGVETLDDADRCIESLQTLGWVYAPEFEESVPHRRYFRKTDSENHTHHLHMVEMNSDWWTRHIRFRDYLREHPEVARTYEDLKRELAERHRWDVDEYAKAKTDFIRNIEERARDYYERR
jgi:GrpB-like predicted nucleotidyltransferase (UPF0157 family)